MSLAILCGRSIRARPDQAGFRRRPSFFAGLLAESGDIPNGRSYHDSWNAVQDPYGDGLPNALDDALGGMSLGRVGSPPRPALPPGLGEVSLAGFWGGVG
jgi:hypothetical protein